MDYAKPTISLHGELKFLSLDQRLCPNSFPSLKVGSGNEIMAKGLVPARDSYVIVYGPHPCTKQFIAAALCRVSAFFRHNLCAQCYIKLMA